MFILLSMITFPNYFQTSSQKPCLHTYILKKTSQHWSSLKTPTLYVIYVTRLSMVGKRNLLAFHPYFIILTTSMDSIPIQFNSIQYQKQSQWLPRNNIITSRGVTWLRCLCLWRHYTQIAIELPIIITISHIIPNFKAY